jgi:uncharacterized protein YdeI (YjbR/CyaY-like superfamily)
LIHHACPQVEEKIKWSMPHFDYKNAPMCHMASFKQHCAFGFWKVALMKDKALLEKENKETSMGHFGKITTLKDLPSDKKLIAFIKEAMKLNDAGIKVSKKAVIKKEIETPDYFLTAIKKNKKALYTYQKLSPSCKKEYVEWVTDAKTELTRDKRLAQAITQIAEGKKLHRKYEKKDD